MIKRNIRACFSWFVFLLYVISALVQVHPWTSSQVTHVGYVQMPIRLEQTLGQHPGHSFREEPFTSSRADTGTEISVAGWSQNDPASHSSHREE
jgi:hypothetical protein